MDGYSQQDGHAQLSLSLHVPHSTAETSTDPSYGPPNPPPTEWHQYLKNTMSDRMYNILIRAKVPWTIHKQLADDDWTDIEGFAALWQNTDSLYDNAATDLRYAEWADPALQRRITARLAVAYDDAKTYLKLNREIDRTHRSKQTVDDTDRSTMETAFQQMTEEKPKLAYQGNANMLGKLNKAAATGTLEYLQWKEIVPFLPAPQIRTEEQRVQRSDGSSETIEVQTRTAKPASLDDWIEGCRTLYTSTMMVLAVHPEHSELQVHWEDLKNYYEEFLFGPTMAKRHQPPSVYTLMLAERRAWQRVITLMWEKRRLRYTLGEALKVVRDDSLWWSNELEKGARPPADFPRGRYDYAREPKGAGRDRRPSPYGSPKPPPPAPWGRPKGSGGKASPKGGKSHTTHQNSKGGKKGGKPNQKGSSKPSGKSSPPSGTPKIPENQWLPAPPGTDYCWNFHVRGACNRTNCNREHTCPGCGKGPHPLHACRSC